MRELGAKAYNESRFHDALRHYERALSLLPNKRGEEAGALYGDMGLCYLQLGENEQALRFFERSLEIARRLANQELLSDGHDHLGQTYTNLEAFEKGEFHLREALNIRKKLNNPYKLGESYNNLGLLYYRMGHLGKALEHYERSLAIAKENNFEQESGYLLGNIGMVYLDLQLYEKAKKYLEESVRNREKFNNPQDLGIGYDNLGGVYLVTGEHEKAIRFFTKALEIRKKHALGEDTALSLMNLGAAYFDLEKYGVALSYYRESLAIFEGLKNPAYVAKNLENMAYAALAMKRYGEAEAYFRRAAEEEKKISKRFGLGMVELHLATKNYGQALAILRNAPDTPTESPSYKIQLYTLHGLALLNTGRAAEAATMFLKAVNIAEDIRLGYTEKQQFFKSGLYGGFVRPYRGLVAALCELSLKNSGLPREFAPYGADPAAAAFYFSELTKGRTLLEAMAGASRQTQKTEIPDDLKRREEEIQSQLTSLDKRWEEELKKGEEAVKNLQARRERIKGQLKAFINTLRKDYPRYAALHYPLPVKAAEIPLKDNEVLFEYALFDNAAYLFVVRKGGVKQLLKLPITRQELEEEVKTFLAPMNDKRPEGFSIPSARRLYEILLANAVGTVRNDEQIIIVPDGILGLLPFEALVVAVGAERGAPVYFVDKQAVSYYQSATILALQRVLQPKIPSQPLFAIGNPIYSPEDPRYRSRGAREEFTPEQLKAYAFRGLAVKEKWGKVTPRDEGKVISFPPLPETEREIRKIAEIMGVRPEAPDVLLLTAAREDNLKRTNLEKYRYLHFATHASLPGMIQGVNEPFILLGQVEKGKEDGFLTLSEVAALPINAEMVVLSACVTGVGREVEGEGVVNFARA
ncbi:MAG: tetratricopeptide repeat protein, partial [Syntrophales bacterium]|nr:tetratricopeptide repeat protein [Syntrophales bacterium]